MAKNTSAIKRGWSYDKANSRLDIYTDGTEVAYFDAANGLAVSVNGFDLAGQSETSVNALGSTAMITWLAALGTGANGADDEDPVYAVAFKVGGTTYYAPIFASVSP